MDTGYWNNQDRNQKLETGTRYISSAKYLRLFKTIYALSTCVVFTGIKFTVQGYTTYLVPSTYCTMSYCMPEYFRAELSEFMSGIRRTIAQEIHNISVQFYVVKFPLLFPVYTQMCEIVYSFPKPRHFFQLPYLLWNFPWWIGQIILLDPIWNIFTREIIFIIYFS